MSKEPNRAARSRAARPAASTDVDEIRQNLRRRWALSLIVATLVVIAETAVLRPSLETPKRPSAKRDPIDAPAFAPPAQPPSDMLVGGKLRIG